MEEIIRLKNSSYSRYEELLYKRDALRKEAFQYQQDYVREFGDLILQVFRKKLDCIRKKKTITYCQQILNRGGVIDFDSLDKYLNDVMSQYNEQLDDMIRENECANNSKPISEIDVLNIKKLYRKLAKQLHPDMNPKVQGNEKLEELWQRVVLAYNCNDLKELESLEVLVNKALEDENLSDEKIDIPNLDEKIAEVEAEIKEITETDPYMYKFLLEDSAAVEEKKKELTEELKSYEEYEKELDALMNEIMADGVTFKWQMN